MLKGYVERRLSQRVPFQVDLTIHFEDGNQQITATAVDISAGGIQFALPWGCENLAIGQQLELVFNLPVMGPTSIHSEILHQYFGINSDQNRLSFYGAKFLDITLQTWNYLLEFSQPSENPEIVPSPHKERKDIRIDSALITRISLESGQSLYALAEDISFGGIKLRTPVALTTDQFVTIQFLTKENQFSLDGLIIWCHPGDSKQTDFLSGIFFNRLDPEKFNQLRSLVLRIAQ